MDSEELVTLLELAVDCIYKGFNAEAVDKIEQVINKLEE